jgi:hypothetical protein
MYKVFSIASASFFFKTIFFAIFEQHFMPFSGITANALMKGHQINMKIKVLNHEPVSIQVIISVTALAMT